MLGRVGVPLHSPLCILCNTILESVCHLFFFYNVSSLI